MVDRVSRRGYRDWFVQRITALLIGLYTIFIVLFLLIRHPMTYQEWHHLFSHFLMKIVTLIVIFSILWHAWIGIWTVLTDYVKNKPWRLVLETLVGVLLLAYLIWAVKFLWVVSG